MEPILDVGDHCFSSSSKTLGEDNFFGIIQFSEKIAKDILGKEFIGMATLMFEM